MNLSTSLLTLLKPSARDAILLFFLGGGELLLLFSAPPPHSRSSSESDEKMMRASGNPKTSLLKSALLVRRNRESKRVRWADEDALVTVFQVPGEQEQPTFAFQSFQTISRKALRPLFNIPCDSCLHS